VVSYPTESIRAEARRRGVTVYRVRLERGVARGLTKRGAVGHARPGETTAKQIQDAKRRPSGGSRNALEMAVLDKARQSFGLSPYFWNPQTFFTKLRSMKRTDLVKLLQQSPEEWRRRARAARRHGVKHSIYYYHGD
jgi:hypothetical protein